MSEFHRIGPISEPVTDPLEAWSGVGSGVGRETVCADSFVSARVCVCMFFALMETVDSAAPCSGAPAVPGMSPQRFHGCAKFITLCFHSFLADTQMVDSCSSVCVTQVAPEWIIAKSIINC